MLIGFRSQTGIVLEHNAELACSGSKGIGICITAAGCNRSPVRSSIRTHLVIISRISHQIRLCRSRSQCDGSLISCMCLRFVNSQRNTYRVIYGCLRGRTTPREFEFVFARYSSVHIYIFSSVVAVQSPCVTNSGCSILIYQVWLVII